MNYDTLNSAVSAIESAAENNYTCLSGALDKLLSEQQQTEVDEELSEFVESSSESNLAKAIAASTAIACKANGKEINPFIIASQAEQAAVLIKGAIDVVNGDITVDELTDKVVDMAECRIIAYADNAVDILAATSGAIVAEICPPLAPVALQITQLCQTIKPRVKEGIHTVVHTVGTFTKKAVPAIVEKVKDAARWLFS